MFSEFTTLYIMIINSPSQRALTPNQVFICKDKWYNTKVSQREWSIRLQRMFRYITNPQYKVNGMVVYVTLTFDDAHLPHLSDYDSTFVNDDGSLVSCHDGERVSEQLIRHLRQDYDYEFSYVFFPEFGSDDYYTDRFGRVRKGTNRPHYHGLMFFYKKVNLVELRQRILKLWDSCIDECLDCVEIQEDYGFCCYVSKYVSKGYEQKMFPKRFFAQVGYARKKIAEMRSVALHDMDSIEYTRLSDAVKLVHFYETHRPKVLCSNGIGSQLPFTSADIMKGTIQVFNGEKYVDVPIPSYNMRKAMYDCGKHDDTKYWICKDGTLKDVTESHNTLTHWNLTQFGKQVKLEQDKRSRIFMHEHLTLIFKKTGVITPQQFEYFHSHSITDFDDFKTWDEITHFMLEQIDDYFKGFDIADLLFYYRKTFQRYCVQHIDNMLAQSCPYYKFEFPCYCKSLDDKKGLHSELHEFLSSAQTLLDYMYSLDTDYYNYAPSPLHPYFYSNIRISFDCLEVIDKYVRCVTHVQNYENYIEKKRKRDLEREMKRKIKGFDSLNKIENK